MENIHLPRILRKSYSPPRRVTKAVAARYQNLPSHSDPAIIVYPAIDRQGDYTHPDGGDWTPFRNNPVVNIDHGPYIGTGTVTMQAIEVDGKTVSVPVGVSKLFSGSADLNGLQLTQYDRSGNVVGKWDKDICLQAAEEVSGPILAGILDGVSVEMSVEKGGFKSLGKAPVFGMDRSGLEIMRWKGITYAHTHMPVNRWARQLLDDDAPLQVAPLTPYWQDRVEKAIGMVKDLPSGSLYMRKALSSFVSDALAGQPDPKRVTVRVKGSPPSANGKHVKKAFPPKKEEGDDETAAPPAKKPMPKATEQAAPEVDAEDPAVAEDDDEYGLGQDDPNDPAAMAQQALDDGTEPVPVGIGASLDFVQALSDACSQYADAMKASDNPKLIAFSNAEIAKVMKRGAFIQRYADSVGAKIKSGGAGEVGESPEDEDFEDDDGTEVDPAEPEEGADAEGEGGDIPEKKKKDTPDTDDDGNVVSKSFTHFTPRRHYKSELKRRPTPAPPQVPTAEVKNEAADAIDPATEAKLDKLLALLMARKN